MSQHGIKPAEVCTRTRRVSELVLVWYTNILMYIQQLVRVYKIPLTGPSQLVQIPVSRGSSPDDHDVAEIQSIWSIEGRQRKFTTIERIASRAPPPPKVYPYKSIPPYQALRTGMVLKPSKRSRKRTFDIYFREGLEYEMPFNETLKDLDAQVCIRAEFIIMEHTTGRQRLTDCKSIDKVVMNYLALEWVQFLMSLWGQQSSCRFVALHALWATGSLGRWSRVGSCSISLFV